MEDMMMTTTTSPTSQETDHDDHHPKPTRIASKLPPKEFARTSILSSDWTWKFPKEEHEGDMGDEVDVVDDDDDDDDDDEVEGEKGEREEIPKLMVDDNKLATNGQHQVPNEDERECKKPRFAEGFGCQGEAESFV